ncbi:MAG TPA: nucleotide exchange factor GrpE, partial [Actinobacteria bacterium]|nr:nucleotide exchange factor GrpE [Actinomycetota bacterium]
DQLRVSREEVVDLRDRLQRMTADFDNFRKRVERDHLRMITSASERVVKQLLPTLDAFDAALAHSPTTESETNLLNGMASTHAQLLDTLSKEGLEPTPGAGVPFDPTIHEAVTGPTDGNGDLIVTQELRRGYTMHGKVVRPALVAVDNK